MIDDWKLEPQTAEEAKECRTVEGMRKRLNRYQHTNPLVRAIFNDAHYRGLSGDDTMTWLAFEALRRLERLENLMLEQAMRSPMPPVIFPRDGVSGGIQDEATAQIITRS